MGSRFGMAGLGVRARAVVCAVEPLEARWLLSSVNLLTSFNTADGSSPVGGVVLSGSTLYGATSKGGGGIGGGVVFSLPATGGAPTVLTSFNGVDGYYPEGGVIVSGNTLYGTTEQGGSAGEIFSLPITGGTPTLVATFTIASGYSPIGNLILSGNTLYGTTSGSSNENAEIFSVPATGGTPKALASFPAYSLSNLILSGDTLYGEDVGNGTSIGDQVFSLSTSGGNPSILATFNGTDGSFPTGELALSGNVLYGTTVNGGTNNLGVVFSLPTSGGTPTVLASFNGTDGEYPSGIILSGGILYGATSEGTGTNNAGGEIFSLPAAGGTPTVLASCDGGLSGPLILSGGTLFGTTALGGSNNVGSVFSLTISVPGSLTGIQSTAASSYNLTTLGATDWAHWGRGGVYGNFDHKAAGNSQISNVTALGSGSYGAFSTSTRNVSWTDGTPTASDSDDSGYIYANNAINAGYSFTVPAGIGSQTLYVYLGGYSSGSTLTAHLSDESAPDYVDTISSSTNYTDVVAITFNASTTGQTLTVSYVKSQTIGSAGGSSDLIAAWLEPTWLSAGSNATWNTSTQVLTVNGPASIIADPGTDEPIVQANGSSAVLTLDPASGIDIHLGGLSLTSGASATVTSLGSARSTTNYHLLVIGTPGATVAPLYTIDATSTLDLADNDMAILYGSGASPLSTVSSEISQAYDNKLWDKPGLTSSIAKTSNGVTALGFGEASTLGMTTFDGLTLGGNAVLVKYTLTGDANLDGSVNLADYNTVIGNLNGSGQTWTSGSFDYSGAVSLGDYNDVISNFNQTLANVLPGGSSPALARTTVKPTSITPATGTPTHKKSSNSSTRSAKGD